MPRAATRDWEDASRLYRALHVVVPRPLLASMRTGVRGAEHLRGEDGRGMILASNHFAGVDPFLVSALVPRPVRWIAKREVFENPVLARAFRSLGAIPVDRQRGGNVEAFREAVAAIETGHVLGIFPEGTRSATARVGRPRTGVARLATLTGAPVVPVAVLSERFWPKRRAVPDWRERVWIRVAPPVSYPRDPPRADDAEAMRKLADDIMARVEAALDECRAARARGEAWPRP